MHQVVQSSGKGRRLFFPLRLFPSHALYIIIQKNLSCFFLFCKSRISEWPATYDYVESKENLSCYKKVQLSNSVVRSSCSIRWTVKNSTSRHSNNTIYLAPLKKCLLLSERKRKPPQKI